MFSYLGAVVYVYWENARAMAFDSTGIAGNFEPGQFVRAREGWQKLLDQNTGDGTIVALGFLGAEVLSKSVDKLAKKAGLKGFDPTIRFLSSVGFGVAAILTTKIIAERATEDNFTKMLAFAGKIFSSVDGGLRRIGRMSESTAERVGGEEDMDIASLALATRIESEEST